MEVVKTSYQKTGYFSKMMNDYLHQESKLRPFYNRFPHIENFKAQIEEKKTTFSKESRVQLNLSLLEGYAKILDTEIHSNVTSNIEFLLDENTFTITTGHQLNLFTGPAYFLYKIISVINLCKQLKEAYPTYHFVPIYWMASEDHDFEEIQYFNFKGKKNIWDRATEGAVGRMSTEGLDGVFEEFSEQLNSGQNASELKRLFENAYLKHNNLADASRYLVNELFGAYGLVVVDGDNEFLKREFFPYAKRELEEQVTYNHIQKTNKELEALDYKIQVNPREINLFYLGANYRERIIVEQGQLEVNQKNKKLTIEGLREHGTSISPNALLRPLYQEIVLPNLCYIGGGGELAYWMQLKEVFKAFEVTFPVLLLRNSALLVSEKQYQKSQKLEVSIDQLFLKQQDLVANKVKGLSQIDFDFEAKKKLLQENFKELEEIAKITDASFIGAVKAQETKQLKGLENLEKRLLKAEKKRLYDVVTRIEILQNQLFPNQSLQERTKNFSEFYEVYGKELIKKLFETLNPLDTQNFTTLIL